MNAAVRHLAADHRGAVAVEYGLVASLISAAIILALAATGAEVAQLFNMVADEYQQAAGK